MRTEIHAVLPTHLPMWVLGAGKPGFTINRDRDEVWWFDGVCKEPDRLVAAFDVVNRCFRMIPQVPCRGNIGDRSLLNAVWVGPYKGRGWKNRLANDLAEAILALDIKPAAGTPQASPAHPPGPP